MSLRQRFKLLSIAASAVCVSVIPHKASAITPSFVSPGNESAIYVNPQTVNSFGYFFDINDPRRLDALGFAAPITGTGNYEVKLWKYINGGTALGDYTQLATATFNQACTGCTPLGNYQWLNVSPVSLTKTSDDVDPLKSTGYAVTAIGNFTTGQNVVYYNGTGFFQPFVDYNSTTLPVDGGYNYSGSPGGDLYPVPLYPQGDIISGPGDRGFFNANFSTSAVPGPLPVMGAAAAFGWSKRMRRRIKLAKAA